MSLIHNWMKNFMVYHKQPLLEDASVLSKILYEYSYYMRINSDGEQYHEIVDWMIENCDDYKIISLSYGHMICFNNLEDVTALKLKFRL